MHKKYLSIFLLFLVSSLGAQSHVFKKQLDSIHKLRQLSHNTEFGLETRIAYAKQAVALSKRTGVDSVFLRSIRILTIVYLEDVKYFDTAKKTLHKNLKLANELKDSLSITYISHQLVYLCKRENNDSAYYYNYNALRHFKNASFSKIAKHKIAQATNLNSIAQLQKDKQDYIGSQTTTIQAINLILTVPENKKSKEFLSNAYNSLGLNLKKLKEYDRALDYFQKSMDISKRTPDEQVNKLYAKINIAEVYKETGDYKKAFDIYDKLLEDPDLFKKDPSSYGAILCNIAYTLFLAKEKHTAKIDSLFTKAHNIFEGLKLDYELSASSNDMSEFYQATNEKEKALFYAEKAYSISKTAQLYEEELRALKQLSRLKAGEVGKAHLYEYIALHDSLIANERANRNKFARIQFETDQHIQETKRLSTQNILISIIAAIFVLSLGLLHFIRLQKGKNQRLLFDREQQEANQEIYGLMLRQQAKLEEGRMQERHRIAEDLHDGILSQLLGTRMNMGFLDLKGDDGTMGDYHRFLDEIQKIEKEIRSLSHELKGDEVLTRTNFESMMDQYLKTQSLVGGFEYEIVNRGVLFDSIQDFTKVNIYRILQEAVQNIVKHARANHVRIGFYLEAERLNLTIEDDGVGFDANSDKKGIGLKNMASRAEKLKGSFRINTVPNKKTVIHIIVPI
ncbi:Oxygen sensor histidine kinase NreB [Mariniflexile rhizosphaerae]|uniref:tetratricopeptide repeat-containing sensor histidine kinase n=1 Tax=unclassified Mariniflexile TaxID=2643887 RepID=UPI000CB7D08A|nr:tetratricopeptide repeat-containing sensor histidine kinase [Mariniflexile sp. TRM1-10]AXP80665.1 Oxygen sensor histidine kinase NreB [Mariniflexile sp. TRM1-10]PLB17779.1 MAG: Sensory box histidine kinase [Flavobacteriaceae bacterium FS1-H7996/R]